MCTDNLADHSINYINSQLRALYENAAHCVETHLHDVTIADFEARQYDFALAHFSVGNEVGKALRSSNNLFFYADFGLPTVDFICNHEAVVTLHLTKGHFNLDLKAHKGRGLPDHRLNHSIDNFVVSFRVEFHGRTISGGDSTMSHGKKHIKYLNFDFNNATYMQSASSLGQSHNWESTQSRETAIIHYLQHEYLPFLSRCGHNVLFSLPDFDDRGDERPHIDYSLRAASEHIQTDTLHGVSIKDINQFLSKKWLTAALRAFEDDEKLHPLEIFEDEGEDCRCRARFSPPEVRVLCKREVALIFNVDHLSFFLGEHFKDEHVYKGWKFALILNVECIEEDGGNVRWIKLRFDNVRQCGALSFFGGITAELYWLQAYFFDLIQERYLQLLVDFGFDVLHHYDIRLTVTVGGEASKGYAVWGAAEEDDEASFSGEISISGGGGLSVTYGASFGFDHVCAISERSINARIRMLWEQANTGRIGDSVLGGLVKWGLKVTGLDAFEAEFGCPQIRLSGSGEKKAEFIIHLTKGYIWTHLGTDHAHRHDFTNWYLVFEVDIKTRTVTEEIPSTCDLGHFHSHKSDRSIREIYLDFNTKGSCRFMYEKCQLPGNELHSMIEQKDTALALAAYVQREYLGMLMNVGHNILFSVPVFSAHAHGEFGLTDFTFRVHCNPVIGKKAADIFLLILGVCGGRTLPAFPSGKIVIRLRDTTSFGVITIARSLFFDNKLLARLARINSVTTIIPTFAGVLDGKWKVALTTWAKDQYKKDATTRWRFGGKDEGKLVYDWRNRDEWTYRHEGELNDSTNGAYVVACETNNVLRIPTSHRSGGLNITVSGEVKLKLTFTGIDSNWSNESVAKWSATIGFASENGGLILRSSSKQIVPTFEGVRTHGECSHPSFTDSCLLLENQLRNAIDLEEALSGIGGIFQGRWPHIFTGRDACALANPTFNDDGDLLFSLVPFVKVQAASVISTTTSRPTIAPVKGRKSYASVKPPAEKRPIAPSRTSSWLDRAKEKVGLGSHHETSHVTLPGTPKKVVNGGGLRSSGSSSSSSVASHAAVAAAGESDEEL